MEGWAAAKDKGNASYKSGDLTGAIQHFSEVSGKVRWRGLRFFHVSHRIRLILSPHWKMALGRYDWLACNVNVKEECKHACEGIGLLQSHQTFDM